MKFTCQAYWANTNVSSSLILVLIKEIEGISVSHSTNVYSGISVSIMTWSNGYKCTILRFVYMSHETSLPWPKVWRKSRQCCTSLSQGNSFIIICNIIQKENICHKNKIHNVILSGMWNLRIIASLMRLSNLMIGICIGSLIFNTWYLCESEHVV